MERVSYEGDMPVEKSKIRKFFSKLENLISWVLTLIPFAIALGGPFVYIVKVVKIIIKMWSEYIAGLFVALDAKYPNITLPIPTPDEVMVVMSAWCFIFVWIIVTLIAGTIYLRILVKREEGGG
ncbi:hypothetical protein ACFL0O_00295 [Thermodesulfobacteriota bacterium]